MNKNQALSKNYKLSIASIIISLCCIVAELWINQEIANRYLLADGKTKALFGLVEIAFSYRYYFVIPAIFALVLAVVAYRKKNQKALISIVLAIVAVLSVFVALWKYMI